MLPPSFFRASHIKGWGTSSNCWWMIEGAKGRLGAAYLLQPTDVIKTKLQTSPTSHGIFRTGRCARDAIRTEFEPIRSHAQTQPSPIFFSFQFTALLMWHCRLSLCGQQIRPDGHRWFGIEKRPPVGGPQGDLSGGGGGGPVEGRDPLRHAPGARAAPSCLPYPLPRLNRSRGACPGLKLKQTPPPRGGSA